MRCAVEFAVRGLWRNRTRRHRAGPCTMHCPPTKSSPKNHPPNHNLRPPPRGQPLDRRARRRAHLAHRRSASMHKRALSRAVLSVALAIVVPVAPFSPIPQRSSPGRPLREAAASRSAAVDPLAAANSASRPAARTATPKAARRVISIPSANTAAADPLGAVDPKAQRPKAQRRVSGRMPANGGVRKRKKGPPGPAPGVKTGPMPNPKGRPKGYRPANPKPVARVRARSLSDLVARPSLPATPPHPPPLPCLCRARRPCRSPRPCG